MRDLRQPKLPRGTGDVPPFWIQTDEDNRVGADPRVVEKAEQLWPWAYRHVGLVLHDPAHAAELLEEVAIDVSERLRAEPEVGRNLRGYLITAFHNRVGLELFRAGRITYEGLVQELEHRYHLIATNWLVPLEIKICVRQVIALMPPDAQRVVNYRLLDYEWDEIAEAMGIQVMQAKNKYYYGLRTAWDSLDGQARQNRRRSRRNETETN